MSDNVRLRVHLVYEYETDPENYPQFDEGYDVGLGMAEYDLDADASIVFDSDSKIERVEILGAGSCLTTISTVVLR